MKVKINSNTRVHIVVVGCGGTGSQLLPFLMQLCNNVAQKIDSITLVDGDHFEDKNILNQRCLPDEVGENKAEALCERYSYIYERLNIGFYADYIKTLDDLFKITRASKYDDDRSSAINILISCVDRNSSRKLFHEYFNDSVKNGLNLVYIDAGNGDKERVGQVITGYTCNKEVYSRPVADYFPEILEDKEDLSKIGEHCTQVISKNPQNIATNIMSATIIFAIVTNIISFAKIEKGIVYFDADKQTVISR